MWSTLLGPLVPAGHGTLSFSTTWAGIRELIRVAERCAVIDLDASCSTVDAEQMQQEAAYKIPYYLQQLAEEERGRTANVSSTGG